MQPEYTINPTDPQPTFANYRGQFVLAKDARHLPSDWPHISAQNWHLAVNDLPVRRLVNDVGSDIGLCIGYPIGRYVSNCMQIKDAEAFYDQTGGAFILLLDGKLMLDPCGMLPAVFHTEDQIVASTPTLIPTAQEWDRELIAALKFPTSDLWFPFGLTSRTKVRRLLPNHSLTLDSLSVCRHWPASETDLSINEDTHEGVLRITETMTGTMQAVQQPLAFTLTAGKDSRMILACAREMAHQATFQTFAQEQETFDTHIARLLAAQLGLKHELIPVQQSSEVEMMDWLYRTGHAVAGGIWRINKTLESLDPTRVLVVGMAGEVGRAYYWVDGDRDDIPIKPDQLLQRIKMPDVPALREAAKQWLGQVAHLGTFTILDLLYIEQRLGCWAAPARFGNVRSLFEFTPFNHRRVISAMLRLPYAYRATDQLPIDVCQFMWPELLDLPFNRFVSLSWIQDEVNSRIKSDVQALETKLQDLICKLEQSNACIQAMQASLSWKITAPLRWVGRRL